MISRKKKTSPKKTKEELEQESVKYRCINCSNAYLMKDGNNPIIAMCPLRNNDREVARLFPCPDKKLFKENKGEIITHEIIKVTNSL